MRGILDIPLIGWFYFMYHMMVVGAIFMSAAALSDKITDSRPEDRNSENYIIIGVLSIVVIGVFYGWLKLPFRPFWAQAIFGLACFGLLGSLLPKDSR